MISHSYHYCSLITDCLKKISETGLPGDEIKLATQFPDGDLRSMVSKFNSMPSTLRESFTQDYSSVNISENEKDNKISWKIYLAEVGALNTAFAATQSCGMIFHGPLPTTPFLRLATDDTPQSKN